MLSVENAECIEWKMRSVENAECGKCGVYRNALTLTDLFISKHFNACFTRTQFRRNARVKIPHVPTLAYLI